MPIPTYEGFYWRYKPLKVGFDEPDIVEVIVSGGELGSAYYTCGGDITCYDFEDYLFVGPLMPPSPDIYVSHRSPESPDANHAD